MALITKCEDSKMVNTKIFLQVLIYGLYMANVTPQKLPMFWFAIENSFVLFNMDIWEKRTEFWIVIVHVILSLDKQEVHCIIHGLKCPKWVCTNIFRSMHKFLNFNCTQIVSILSTKCFLLQNTFSYNWCSFELNIDFQTKELTIVNLIQNNAINANLNRKQFFMGFHWNLIGAWGHQIKWNGIQWSVINKIKFQTDSFQSKRICNQ